MPVESGLHVQEPWVTLRHHNCPQVVAGEELPQQGLILLSGVFKVFLQAAKSGQALSRLLPAGALAQQSHGCGTPLPTSLPVSLPLVSLMPSCLQTPRC